MRIVIEIDNGAPVAQPSAAPAAESARRLWMRVPHQ